jgi:hypothetical protein
MNQLTINIEKIHQILTENKDDKFQMWQDLVRVYESSLGGCNCSKQNRINAANDYFKGSILRDIEKNSAFFDTLKTHLNTDKILFEDMDKNIFAEV